MTAARVKAAKEPAAKAAKVIIPVQEGHSATAVATAVATWTLCCYQLFW